MGYSTSIETIERVQTVLDIMLAVTDKPVSFPTKDPRKLTYAIRDALHSCKHFHTEYGKYLVIQERFKIKQGTDKITFVPKELPEAGPPIEELKKSYSHSSEITLSGPTEALEIIGALIEHKPAKAIFPNAKLQGLDMTKIAGWGMKNRYKITEVNPLTIEKE